MDGYVSRMNDYIIKYNAMSPNGYNVAVGGMIGMSFLGRKHTEETKKILSEKTKAYNSNPEVRERARRVAIEFTKTHNIGELQRKSEKWQKALAEGRIGGHARTEESKKNISKGMKEYHKGNKNKHSEIMTNAIGRKISQYTHDNKLIESFDSIKIAMKKNKNIKFEY